MRTLGMLVIIILAVTAADGAVVEYNTADRDQWFNDVGGLSNISTVDFTGYSDFTLISDQWAYLGIHFSGLVFTSGENHFGYPQDGWGCEGYPDINVTFDESVNWVAADFPGGTTIELYDNDQLLYASSNLGGGGTGFFGGLISDEAFNRVRFFEVDNHVEFLDNIYFGPPIAVPVPGAIALTPLVLLFRRRRR